ncbi:hypothetical protein, partial [Xenorhabdus stockiae]|uniref:hypothetical protein n=1 Tax=Xenorhabdus stockiae TaxID=351614 RepID=UPI001B80C658
AFLPLSFAACSAQRRSVVAHYREFFGPDNSFFEKNYRLLHYTAKGRFIPSYTQCYQQSDILVKIVEHRANVCVTI